MSITDAFHITGQVVLPVALVFGGYVAGYIHGNINGISTILLTRKGKK